MTAEQHAAVERALKHLAEARAAYCGCRDDDDESDAEATPPGSVLVREDRAAMLVQAIVGFDRASRILRQSGLKLSARVADETERGLAELSFRRAGA